MKTNILIGHPGTFTGGLTRQFLMGPKKIGGPEGAMGDFEGALKSMHNVKTGEKEKKEISSPKASNGQRFPCPALISPWFSWGEAGQRPR